MVTTQRSVAHATVSALLRSVSRIDQCTDRDLFQLMIALKALASQTGGPYATYLPIDEALQFNRTIYTFFLRSGKRLSETEAFLRQHHALPRIDTPRIKHNPSLAALRHDAHASLLGAIRQIPEEASGHIEPALKAVLSTDKNGEISALHAIFAQSIHTSFRLPLSNEHTALIGAANLATWTAYTLYDSLVDEAGASIHSVGYANMLLRRAVHLYTQALSSASTTARLEDAHRLYDIVDTALSTEQSLQLDRGISPNIIAAHHALLGDKSIAHIAGILIATDHHPFHHKQIIYEALWNYCAARQLNDDLHDWTGDFMDNRTQYVTVRILSDMNLSERPSYSKSVLRNMQRVFWEHTLESLLQEQLQLLQRTKELLAPRIMPIDAPFLKTYIEPLIQKSSTALRVHKVEKEFLVLYASSARRTMPDSHFTTPLT